MSETIKLKKGFEINLEGKPQSTISEEIKPDTFALKPTDFHGVLRGKVLVEEGDTVKAGSPLFFDKKMEEVLFTSPVSGEVVEIRRGAKRKLLEIVVLADKENEYEDFGKHSASEIHNLSKEAVLEKLAKSGVWPSIIQRPYGIIANPVDTPKSIFISGFDTSPLAPDASVLYKGEDKYLQTGIDILKKLTDGTIHLNLEANSEVPTVFSQIQGAQINKFSGPHPAGNVGVQIHHIDPVNKGELVWTLTPYGVIQIGKLFSEGIYDASKIIALTGSQVSEPKYYRTYNGAGIKKFAEGTLKGDHNRIISGNVLTGEKVETSSHLGYYHQQLTVIPEGDYHELFGWILPSTKKLSFHKGLGLLSFLNPKKEYVVDTNLHGEERAFVTTGTFEEVTPMDIYPTYLLKAILAEDYDEMEELGIYEVIEEDLALCEFIDVSKHDVQAIVREGIDLMING
jgi:Na+-transporting NADH:ubiquinone oxidoreductase subunit A